MGMYGLEYSLYHSWNKIRDGSSCILSCAQPDVRPHVKWAVSLVIANDNFFNDLCEYIRVNITHFITPEGCRVRACDTNVNTCREFHQQDFVI